MTRAEILLAEIKSESVATRKTLERVPVDKKDYKPHEKSMTLGRLATHVAEIYSWWQVCLVNDELDFAKSDYKPTELTSTEDLLKLFDGTIADAQKILSEVQDAEFDKPWTMRQGETIFFTMPKFDVVRTWCMNHLYHHRAQLGVYLRLLNVEVPSTYGPSADEQ